MILPCPMCSSVIREGVHRDPVEFFPTWFYARHTSERTGINHWMWFGCTHASPVGPTIPTEVRQPTEDRWNAEARRLLELRTANWSATAREDFATAFGFKKPVAELQLEPT